MGRLRCCLRPPSARARQRRLPGSWIGQRHRSRPLDSPHHIVGSVVRLVPRGWPAGVPLAAAEGGDLDQGGWQLGGGLQGAERESGAQEGASALGACALCRSVAPRSRTPRVRRPRAGCGRSRRARLQQGAHQREAEVGGAGPEAVVHRQHQLLEEEARHLLGQPALVPQLWAPARCECDWACACECACACACIGVKATAGLQCRRPVPPF